MASFVKSGWRGELNDFLDDLPILVCGSGDFHRQEVLAFIQRHPGRRIIAAVDIPIPDYGECIIIHSKGYLAKIEAMIKCDCSEFLYVDTDTTIFSLNGIQFYRDRYDISVSFEPLGITEKVTNPSIPFSGLMDFEFQTGVILIRKTEKVRDFLEIWFNAHKTGSSLNGHRFADQISFRYACTVSTIPIGVLPYCFNFRPMYLQLISEPIRILHSRRPDSYRFCSDVISDINSRYIITRHRAIKFDFWILKLLRWVMRAF